MSYKFDSLIMILNKLESRKPVTVNSLMNDLEISDRSIYRYIRTLQVAGFPIEYDRQKGIYSFSDGYSLRKLNLSLEEQLAFSLAKNFLGSFGANMQKSLGSIEDKLAMRKTDLPRHIVLTADKPLPQVSAYFSIVHEAIQNFQRIEFDYNAVHSRKLSHRKIDPHYLFFNEGFWYLRGYCHEAEEMRTFAFDRMKDLKTLNQYFIPRKDLIPEEELSAAFGTWIDGDPYDIVLRFSAEAKEMICRKKWHKSQQEKELKDGGIEIRFRINGLGGIKKWINQWMPFVEVVEPKMLRNQFKQDLKKSLVINK